MQSMFFFASGMVRRSLQMGVNTARQRGKVRGGAWIVPSVAGGQVYCYIKVSFHVTLRKIAVFTSRSGHRWFIMRQPYSIRVHLTGVFLIFFLLVVVLGSFSIWRLNNFNHLSADVAELWLPETRVLGDLNSFNSDFRAFEGGNLLSSDAAESAASEGRMAALD